MGLTCGPEVLFNANVQLAVGPSEAGNAKPTTPAGCQRGWLWQFLPPQRLRIEGPLRSFAADRAGHLDVVYHPTSLNSAGRQRTVVIGAKYASTPVSV